jgi:hypothetical protein
MASPNVDAIGPDVSLFLMYGGGGWYAGLSGGLMQHPFTDDAMREHTTTELASLRPGAVPPGESSATIWFYDPSWPAVLRTSAALRAGTRAGGHWHDAIVSISDAKRYFHYSEPFGGEVPTDQRLVLGALSGAFGGDGGGAGTRAGYRAGIQHKSLEDRDQVLTFDYDWAVTRLRADADVAHAFGGARVRLDAGIEQREADDPRDELTRTDDTFTRAALTVSGHERAPVSAAATLSGTFADGERAPGASGRVAWVMREADTLVVSAAYRTRLFAEDDNLWLWSERGYSLLAAQGVSYTIDGAIDRTAVTSADLRWTSSGVLGAIDLALGYRRFDDAYLEERDFTFEPESCTFESPTRVVTGQAGNVGTLDLKLWHRLGDNSRGDFSFAYVEEFGSDASFARAWQSVPRHRLTYAMTFRPRPTWTLRGRVAHRSGTSWADYRGVDGAVCRTDGVEVVYHANVPAATTFDLAVQHRFWRRSAAVDLIARNLFGADVKDHPAGATTDFTLYLQLRIPHGGGL